MEAKKMTTHTPGPWTYRPLPKDNPDPNRDYWVDDANGSRIADILNTGNNAEDNAALVAAAPDLLEALIDLLGHAMEQYRHFESPRGQEEIDRARVAIAKAKAGRIF
jgi:hypothetical protein